MISQLWNSENLDSEFSEFGANIIIIEHFRKFVLHFLSFSARWCDYLRKNAQCVWFY